jgi:hypothetical protein
VLRAALPFNPSLAGDWPKYLEAPSRFELLDEGFADPSLSHLGTAPARVDFTRPPASAQNGRQSR